MLHNSSAWKVETLCKAIRILNSRNFHYQKVDIKMLLSKFMLLALDRGLYVYCFYFVNRLILRVWNSLSILQSKKKNNN